MADELKNFPPSEYKLRKLREQGVIPRSRELTTFGALAGFLFALTVFNGLSGKFFTGLQSFWSTSFDAADAARSAGSILIGASLVLLIPLVLLVLIIGAFQTGFLFGAHLVRFDLGKLFAISSRATPRFLPALGALLRAAAWGAVCWLLLRQLLEWTVEQTNQAVTFPATVFSWLSASGTETSLQHTRPVIEAGEGRLLAIGLTVVGFSFLLGVVSRFAAVMAFRNEHSMSRAELEAENRELESSPDVRRRIGELREE